MSSGTSKRPTLGYWEPLERMGNAALAIELLAGALPKDFPLRSSYPGNEVAWFNNLSTHEEVLALFDRAIASAIEKGI